MCLHLSRESLKTFLLTEAKSETDIENAQDSILGKWAAIAKKAKTWLQDENVGYLPSLIDERLLEPLKSKTKSTDA